MNKSFYLFFLLIIMTSNLYAGLYIRPSGSCQNVTTAEEVCATIGASVLVNQGNSGRCNDGDTYPYYSYCEYIEECSAPTPPSPSIPNSISPSVGDLPDCDMTCPDGYISPPTEINGGTTCMPDTPALSCEHSSGYTEYMCTNGSAFNDVSKDNCKFSLSSITSITYSVDESQECALFETDGTTSLEGVLPSPDPKVYGDTTLSMDDTYTYLHSLELDSNITINTATGIPEHSEQISNNIDQIITNQADGSTGLPNEYLQHSGTASPNSVTINGKTYAVNSNAEFEGYQSVVTEYTYTVDNGDGTTTTHTALVNTGLDTNSPASTSGINSETSSGGPGLGGGDTGGDSGGGTTTTIDLSGVENELSKLTASGETTESGNFTEAIAGLEAKKTTAMTALQTKIDDIKGQLTSDSAFANKTGTMPCWRWQSAAGEIDLCFRDHPEWLTYITMLIMALAYYMTFKILIARD